MSRKHSFSVLIFFCIYNLWGQTHFPGGVAGAETWYIVNLNEINLSTYPNLADDFIKLRPCPDNAVTKSLFNFNHSVMTSHLCITYDAPLENTTSRNIFFVGEPTVVQNPQPNLSHLTTAWKSAFVNVAATDSVQNRFDLANQSAYVNKKKTLFTSVSNANINFYDWNIYQEDKKLKSYGNAGETSFYIGKRFTTSTPGGDYFQGNFPEFISFPFELNYNQKNRVESYLALKYGITLAQNTPYRNSKNIVFWTAVNYSKFGNRIFGIGRDDISGLNQLQSESVHNKNYLIASVDKLVDTNPNKQLLVSINDNNFIVFGDNGSADALQPENAVHVRTLSRKWLSQNTGDEPYTIDINFKLFLQGVLQQALTANPHLKLWMLQDRNTNNQTVSDFSSQYVDYTLPVSMDALNSAVFKDNYFDTDQLIYDQFTFGVGPQMIVQVRYDLGDCDDNKIKSTVVISGGTPPYSINIHNTSGTNNNYTTSDNTLDFTAVAPDTYTVTVTDVNSVQGIQTIAVTQPQIAVDLGPDIYLSATQTQVTLNAGQYVTDPTATYQWYMSGDLLQSFDPTLIVTQPGKYRVVVTSGNMMCQQFDDIAVHFNFNASWQPTTGCYDTTASLYTGATGGIAPYTTVVSGATQTFSYVYNTSYVFSNLQFGQYTVTTTDAIGSQFQTTVVLHNPFEGITIDLASQLQQQSCTPSAYTGTAPSFECSSTIQLDASLDITSPNVSGYEWFMNGQSTGIFSPDAELYFDVNTPSDPNGFNEFTVEVTTDNSCVASQTIAVRKFYTITSGVQSITSQQASNTDKAESKSEGDSPTSLSAFVYPNPSSATSTFYYEVSSGEAFDGIVEIISPNGAVIQSYTISGDSSYTLPLTLLNSGVYLISTRSGQTTLTNKIIIN